MIRNCDLNEISDGRLYSSNDMVKAGCNNCEGCSKCCKDMGNSIILDPLDMCRLTRVTKKSFNELINGELELSAVDGMILPNVRMVNGSCSFLNGKGRCSIHSDRPGFCRLFPLGRYYDYEGGFKYILQINECERAGRTKVKVNKWLDTANLKKYEEFVLDWHNFQKRVIAASMKEDENTVRMLNMFIISQMYGKDFKYENEADFYDEYNKRKAYICSTLNL